MRHTNRLIQDQELRSRLIQDKDLCRSIFMIKAFTENDPTTHEKMKTYIFISAIKRKMKEMGEEEVEIQEYLEQYEGLNSIQFLAIFEFGLTREQVLSHNFGYHTSRAIEREMEAGCIPQESFEKYKNLNNIQVDAMTKFGLTREQVLSHNFGDHTSRAIEREIEAGCIPQESFEKYYKGLDSRGVDDILLTRGTILGLLITHNKIKAILSASPAETGGRQSEKEIETVIYDLITKHYGQDNCKMLKYIKSQFIKDDDKGNFSFNTANIEHFCQENKTSLEIMKYLTEKVAELILHVDCVKIDPQYKKGGSVYFAGKLVKNYKSAPVESASAEQVQGQNRRCVIS